MDALNRAPNSAPETGRLAPTSISGRLLRGPADRVDMARRLFAGEFEPCFALVGLDRAGRVKKYVELGRGWLECALVSSQQVLVEIMRTPGSRRFVLVRSRRAEGCAPSDGEARVAGLARWAARCVGVEIEDHVIVGPNDDHYSAVSHHAKGWA